MKRNLQIRLLFILVVLVVSCVLFYPPSKKINLGLDLKGGLHLVIQVKTDDALEQVSSQLRDRIESDLRDKDLVFRQTRLTPSFGIEILGVPQDQQNQVDEYLGQYSDRWDYKTNFVGGDVNYEMTMTAAAKKAQQLETVNQAKETIQRRIDQYGVAEPTIATYGSGDVKDQIIVELPGVDDPGRVIKLIKDVARLELKIVHPDKGGPYPTREAALKAFDDKMPDDYEILPYRSSGETSGTTMFMVVRKAPAITGQDLKNARRSEDPYTGRSEVLFFLNSEGVRRFSRVTADNVGHRLAIVLDNVVQSAPNINERIDTESARIMGNFTPEQAEDLALVLRSGALPAGITVLDQRVVGPSLGMDSIRSGISASLLGLLLVLVGMVVVYRLSGINAIVCLLLNLLILLAALASFHATLTLPGIAGVILTIGMAVDANILIFERIKEELRLGKTVRSAVDAGFGRVFLTIIDTNITTLVAALFLFQFGTGPIRGFAVTLAVGLVANIFTATFVSRAMFDSILQGREVKRISI